LRRHGSTHAEARLLTFPPRHVAKGILCKPRRQGTFYHPPPHPVLPAAARRTPATSHACPLKGYFPYVKIYQPGKPSYRILRFFIFLVSSFIINSRTISDCSFFSFLATLLINCRCHRYRCKIIYLGCSPAISKKETTTKSQDPQ
jgi:hypothetical protein